jgi:hypothetical protein
MADRQYLIRYHANVTDTTLTRYSRLRVEQLPNVAIVPTNCCNLFSLALQKTIKHPPEVRAIEEFISLRVVLTSMDTSWSVKETMRDLIDRYNARVSETGNKELMVNLEAVH